MRSWEAANLKGTAQLGLRAWTLPELLDGWVDGWTAGTVVAARMGEVALRGPLALGGDWRSMAPT